MARAGEHLDAHPLAAARAELVAVLIEHHAALGIGEREQKRLRVGGDELAQVPAAAVDVVLGAERFDGLEREPPRRVQLRLDLDFGQRSERTPNRRLALVERLRRLAAVFGQRLRVPHAALHVQHGIHGDDARDVEPPSAGHDDRAAPRMPDQRMHRFAERSNDVPEIGDGAFQRHRALRIAVAVPALVVRDDTISIAESFADARPPAPRRPKPVHADDDRPGIAPLLHHGTGTVGEQGATFARRRIVAHRPFTWARTPLRARVLPTACTPPCTPKVSSTASAAAYGSRSSGVPVIASSMRRSSVPSASWRTRCANAERRFSRIAPLSRSQASWRAIAFHSLSMPLPSSACVLTNSGTQPLKLSISIIERISRCSCSAIGWSLLFTTNTSAISSTPALSTCTESPLPGCSATSVVSATSAISISDCPTPTVSTSTTSLPNASISDTASAVAPASPPRCPRDAIDRMNTSLSVKCSVRRMRSPRSAPCENGELGSTEITPTVLPSLRTCATIADISLDFPTPGGPVRPTVTARPVEG